MKKILLLASVLCVTFAAIAGSKLFTKNIDVRSFDSIEASSIYRVDLSRDSRCSVSIQAPDYLEPYMVIKVVDGTLRLSMEKLPRNIERRLNEETEKVWATVTMPSVRKITLSGIARLISTQPFVEKDEFRLTMSGAAQVENLRVDAPSARLDLSGAAKCQLSSCVFDKVDLRASGAARLEADRMDLGDVDAELSGAAKVTFDGQVESLEIEASGAARSEWKSSRILTRLEVESSGASRISAEELPARDVEVELSGTSVCRVNALHSIRIETAGASTCLYKAAPDTDVRILSAGRGSSIRKL